MSKTANPLNERDGRFRQLQLLNTGVVKLTGLKAAG